MGCLPRGEATSESAVTWFQIVDRVADAPRNALKTIRVAPPAPTYVWAVTAYYARERAAVYFNSSAMDTAVRPVRDDETLPNVRFELIQAQDGSVEVVPVNDEEWANAPKRSTLERLERDRQLAIPAELERWKATAAQHIRNEEYWRKRCKKAEEKLYVIFPRAQRKASPKK